MSEPKEETLDLPPGAAPPDGITTDPVIDSAAIGGKQGGVCCGCCCDYRRAVVIMSAMSFFFGFLGIIGTLRGQPQRRFGDDAVAIEVGEITDSYRAQSIILGIIGFVFAGCSLFGAVKFRWNLVSLNFSFLPWNNASRNRRFSYTKYPNSGCCRCCVGTRFIPLDYYLQFEGAQ